MELLTRGVTPWVRELLTASPVVVIEGARQVGKSTLASMLGNEGTTYVTMDDDLTRGFARDDPQGLFQLAPDGRLVIDEVQRCPNLILPLKAEIDRDRRPGRFVLTGSANLLRLPGAEDSLAGRAMTVRLQPFSQGELEGHGEDWVSAVLGPIRGFSMRSDRADTVERALRGGYPPVQPMSPKLRSAWLVDYANRLVERDSTDIAPAQVPVLRKLLHLLAAAPGSELVLERLAGSLGVARGTVARYLEILEALFLVHSLPSWSRNLTSRQVHRSKCYITDSGLAAAMMGLTSDQLVSPHGSDHLGPLLENFVVCELLRQQGWSKTQFQLSHFRDRNGAEVDVIIETPRGLIGVEVKAASAARTDHFKHLIGLRDRLGEEFLAGVVLTLGGGQMAGDRLMSLPVSSLWTQ